MLLLKYYNIIELVNRSTKSEMSSIQNREKLNKYKEHFKQHWFEICLVIVCMVFASVWINLSSVQYETSECAIIDGRLISVAPKVSGNVTHVYVENNQEVKKGDLLLEVDSAYYEMRLHQAELNLRNARHKLATQSMEENDQSKLGRAYENSKSPLSKFSFAKHKFNSYESNYDEEYSEPQNDKSCLLDSPVVKQNPAEEKPTEEETNVSKEEKEDLPIDIKKLEGEVEQAKLDLSYTKVYATRDGIITNVDVEEGDYIEVAQPILSIIPKRLYVIASFVTEERNEIKEGLPAIVKIPAYPYRKFKGIVEGVQMYTDEMSDILPVKDGDNKNRILVRISFIEDYSSYNIVPSTNVIAKVKIK